ncbi:MAG: hypothetical protein ACI4UL_07630 [Muribaculaceae bacterium]
MAKRDYGYVRTNISLSGDYTWGSATYGFNARVSYQFLKTKHYSLSGNFRYNSITTDFDATDFDKDFNPNEININGNQTMEQIGLTATASTTLFGKHLTAMAMVNSEWGEGGFNRVSATAMAMMLLRQNRATQFGIGVLGMVNTTSKVPVFPVFVYRHRFSDKWLINIYGGMFGVDYTPSPKSLISAGADIDVKSFYFQPATAGLPFTCRYTQTNFRPMLKYRHLLKQHLYFDVQAGVAINMSSRVNGVNGTKEYIDISQKPHPFVQLSFSYSL